MVAIASTVHAYLAPDRTGPELGPAQSNKTAWTPVLWNTDGGWHSCHDGGSNADEIVTATAVASLVPDCVVCEPRALVPLLYAARGSELCARVTRVPEPSDDALSQIRLVIHQATVAQLAHVVGFAPRALVPEDRVHVATGRLIVGGALDAAETGARRLPVEGAEGLVVARRVVPGVLAVEERLAQYLANVPGRLDGVQRTVVGAVTALERVFPIGPVARLLLVSDLSGGIAAAIVADASCGRPTGRWWFALSRRGLLRRVATATAATTRGSTTSHVWTSTVRCVDNVGSREFKETDKRRRRGR